MSDAFNESKPQSSGEKDTTSPPEDATKRNYLACLQSLVKLENSVGTVKKYEQFRKIVSQMTGLTNDFSSIEVRSPDMCTIFYNHAIALFHLKQPQSALKIMKAVMGHVDVLDDYVVQKAGLFTVTLLLDTNETRSASILLEKLQTRLAIGKDILNIEEEDDDSQLFEKPVVLLDKKKEKSENPFEEFRKMFRLVLIRSHLLNGKLVTISKEETSHLSVLRAHQFYLGIDYQMAAKELSKKYTNEIVTIKTHGEDQNTCLANNMGLIHFAVRHYALAVRFFQQSLTFDQNATENRTAKENGGLQYAGATKRIEILYNLGIALLHLQRPKEAFECLLIPLNSYHNNPRLWLRLAECCVMVHTQNLKEKENKNICSSVISSGVHRKYVIQPSPHKYVSDEDQSFAIPSTNLEFASLCLRNALTLSDHYTENIRKHNLMQEGNYQNTWNNSCDGVYCNPSKPLKLEAFDKLKSAILAAYSYVEICLGEYVLAFKYAKELLKTNDVSDTHRLLGHLYCAEALIMMDRIPEALLYLEPKFINELSSDDFQTRGSPGWNINSLEAAQAILFYNLAVTHLIKGDFQSANIVAMSCKHPIVYTHLKMLKMYIELQAGNIDNCRIMINLDTPQHL